MKVAILSLYSGHLERGVEVWADSLQKALKTKCDIHIFGNKNIKINWDKPDLRGRPLRTFFLDYWSILTARFTLSILKDVHALNPDVIIPTNGGWQAFIMRLYCWCTGKKMIIVGHAGIGADELFNVWCFPDVFVALTHHAAKWAQRKNPFVHVVTIPNGIWTSEFSPTGEKITLNLQHPVFIYVGAIESGKRPSLAIEAVAKLKKGSLLMLGRRTNHLGAEIEHLGNELLGSHRFAQLTVPHSKIGNYYRAADVFTLPTWSQEAFGMVYLEAMACGLPVVTTDDPIKREIIGEAGLFVDPTDLSSYSEALEKATKIDSAKKSIEQAQKFSWDIVSDKYYNLFRKVTY